MPQGDPLAMIAYGIVLFLLIKRLKSDYPDVTQPWYADDAGALVTFDSLELYFNSLKQNSPARGYYANPTKIILIVHTENIEAGKLFGDHHGFNVCTGAHDIIYYIGDG